CRATLRRNREAQKPRRVQTTPVRGALKRLYFRRGSLLLRGECSLIGRPSRCRGPQGYLDSLSSRTWRRGFTRTCLSSTSETPSPFKSATNGSVVLTPSG